MQALLRLPDGSAAAGVPVHIKVSTTEMPWQGRTDQQGAVSTVFNIPSVNSITVEVSTEQQMKKSLLFPSKPVNAGTVAPSGVSRRSSAEESL